MSNLDNAEFTFDTNVFIELFKKYPKDIFISIWKLIEEKFLEKKIIIIKDVVDELSKVHNEVYEYVKMKRENIFELTEDVQENLMDIINRFPKWISPYDERNAADPCLVAVGITFNLKVITQETIKGNKLRIPFVCNKLGVRCGNLFDFLREHQVRI